MIKRHKSQAGFTLMEILVTISIFALVTTLISAVYVGFSNVQARANATQRILNDSQFILEAMAREIRNDLILDYAPYDNGDIDNPSNHCASLIGDDDNGHDFKRCILLQRENGQIVTFTYNEVSRDLHFILLGNCDDALTQCDWGAEYGYTTEEEQDQNDQSYTIMLGPSISNIQVDALNFNITPETDPFVSGGTNRHPKVTIQLEVSYASFGNEMEDVSQLLQTTISSRVYRK